MGWASGSELMDVIIKAAKAAVPDEKARAALYDPVIASFLDHDCDTLEECKGNDSAFDSALGQYGYEEDDDE